LTDQSTTVDEVLAFANRCLEAYRLAEDEHVENERAYRTEAARLLARHRELQGPLHQRMEAIESELQAIVESSPDIIPAGKRSRKLHNGVVGFRKGPDRVEVDQATLESAVDRDKGLVECLRIRREPDKKAILALIKKDGILPDGVTLIPGTDRFYATADRGTF